MIEQRVTDTEQAVLEKLLNYTVQLRDVAARHGMDEQWTRYASASTVVQEVIANGWEDPDTMASQPDDDV